MIWFTSDEHYYHRNIIEYSFRPFADVNAMHKTLIENHNAVVKDGDTVYHVGDFAVVGKSQPEKVAKILDKLNGDHHLILGNHDLCNPFTYVNAGFHSVHTALRLNDLVLAHDPSVACTIPVEEVLLCGHVHTLFLSCNHATIHDVCKVVNVGVDQWSYTPVSIAEVRDLIKTFTKGVVN